MFERVKRFYDLGLYNAVMVYEFCKKGVITHKEYNLIVANK